MGIKESQIAFKALMKQWAEEEAKETAEREVADLRSVVLWDGAPVEERDEVPDYLEKAAKFSIPARLQMHAQISREMWEEIKMPVFIHQGPNEPPIEVTLDPSPSFNSTVFWHHLLRYVAERVVPRILLISTPYPIVWILPAFIRHDALADTLKVYFQVRVNHFELIFPATFSRTHPLYADLLEDAVITDHLPEFTHMLHQRIKDIWPRVNFTYHTPTSTQHHEISFAEGILPWTQFFVFHTVIPLVIERV